MKVRIKYTKSELLKFIGHLDVMRYFQKAVKRAGFDIAYSQGFSPHQLMSFAAPLALGVTSEGEYFDAEFNSLVSSDEFVRRFNEQMAAGMEVKDVVLLPDNAKNSMSIVAASDYMITILESVPNDVKEKILSYLPYLLEKESIKILKKTKKNEKIEDIKPGILKLSVESYKSAKILAGEDVVGSVDGCMNNHNNIEDFRKSETADKNAVFNQYVEDVEAVDKMYMLLVTGSEYNLKPELVIQAVCREIGYEYKRFDYKIHRLETYMKDEEGKLVSLLQSGTRIEG
ncbi:MAG: TIGR03936 family radical SAM-associated protein [Clostridiales bacterium]|nr:TIGR03936 family radical SAM-associated protein [Clostridiales bacterium]